MNGKVFRFVFLIAVIGLYSSLVSLGQPSQLKNELSVGDLKVQKLQDAEIYLNLSLLSGVEEAEALKLAGGVDSVKTPVNAFLVRTPNHLVLVDAGIGPYPGEDSGHLLEQLGKSGVNPADIDLILITHFHFDHISGLTSAEGKRVFPNAIVRASQTESEFWMRDSSLIPENLQGRAKQIQSTLAPYVSADAFRPILPGEELGDGIQALPANGHTPGHTVFTFSSNGEELWCIGDLIHFGVIQFKHPLGFVVFDSDHDRAVASRMAIFQQAVDQKAILGGAHLPKIVRLEKDGEAFVATPVSADE